MVLVDRSYRPTSPESHSAAKRGLLARSSAIRRRTRWSAGYRLAVARSVRDLLDLERVPGLGGVADAAARAEEVAPHRVAVVAAVLPHQRRVQRVGQQQRPGRVADRDGRAGQAVQHPLHARRDVGGHRALPRRYEPGDLEQVLAFGPGQAQCPAEGLDDLARRVGRPALFEAGDVVDRDAGQQRELLAAQPGRAPVAADRQARGLRGDPVAPAPHRVPELRGRHDTTVHLRARFVLALAVPGKRGSWLTGRSRPILRGMTTTLITGANKGLGYETARRLVAAGHTVYLGSRDAERGRRAADRLGARAVQIDVTDESSVRAAAKAIEADGGLDVLVNNAGIQEEMNKDGKVVVGAAELTAELMTRTFETNVFGTVRVLHAFLPLLERSAAPVVVNVSSGLASLTRVATPGTPAYAYPGVAYPVSKAAVNMLTVQYAKAFPAVRINAVEPGFTSTDLNAGTGRQTVEEGAEIIVRMAQVGPDGPTGGYFDAEGTLPW